MAEIPPPSRHRRLQGFPIPDPPIAEELGIRNPDSRCGRSRGGKDHGLSRVVVCAAIATTNHASTERIREAGPSCGEPFIMTDPESPRSCIILVLGSRNRKKCREMAELIAPPWDAKPRLDRLEIHSLAEFPHVPEVVEDADTFSGNARKKASETATALGVWVVADDSGLTVDAREGPRAYSPRVMPANRATTRPTTANYWPPSPTSPTCVAAPRSVVAWRWPIPRGRFNSRPRVPVAAG